MVHTLYITEHSYEETMYHSGTRCLHVNQKGRWLTTELQLHFTTHWLIIHGATCNYSFVDNISVQRKHTTENRLQQVMPTTCLTGLLIA